VRVGNSIVGFVSLSKDERVFVLGREKKKKTESQARWLWFVRGVFFQSLSSCSKTSLNRSKYWKK